MIPEQRTMIPIQSGFQTREAEDGELYIQGYFSVFNSAYRICDGLSEKIAPGAFSDTLGEDIRALTNHDTTLVLGRNKAGTLELREDAHGLWGGVRINRDDQDAMNLYRRVQRGMWTNAPSVSSSWMRSGSSVRTEASSTSSRRFGFWRFLL